MGEEILAFLEGQDGPVTRKDIENSSKRRMEVIRGALAQLVKEGKIKRSDRGKKGDPYHYFSCSRDPQIVVPENTDCEEKTGKDGNNNLSSDSGALVPEKGACFPVPAHMGGNKENKKVKRLSRSTSRG